jgi:hypothetical protein
MRHTWSATGRFAAHRERREEAGNHRPWKLDSFAARTLYPRDLGERLDVPPDKIHHSGAFRPFAALAG